MVYEKKERLVKQISFKDVAVEWNNDKSTCCWQCTLEEPSVVHFRIFSNQLDHKNWDPSWEAIVRFEFLTILWTKIVRNKHLLFSQAQFLISDVYIQHIVIKKNWNNIMQESNMKKDHISKINSIWLSAIYPSELLVHVYLNPVKKNIDMK